MIWRPVDLFTAYSLNRRTTTPASLSNPQLSAATSRRRWWLGFVAVLAALAAFLMTARLHSHSGKVTVVANLERRGFDNTGLAVISPALLRFQDDGRKIPGLAATAVAWSFIIRTTDGRGNFITEFQPKEASFSTSIGDTYEFWVRDARLIDCNWKVRVVRKVRYQLPRIFRFIASTVPGPDNSWESDVITPALSNWKWEPRTQPAGLFHFPDRPTPTNEQPFFLTNGGTIFGERELHYMR